jgi:hypothetical protein
MALDVRNDLAAGKSILFWALPFRGPLEGWALKNQVFLGLPFRGPLEGLGPEKSSIFWALPFRGPLEGMVPDDRT